MTWLVTLLLYLDLPRDGLNRLLDFVGLFIVPKDDLVSYCYLYNMYHRHKSPGFTQPIVSMMNYYNS